LGVYHPLRPNVNSLASLVSTSIDSFIFRTLLGASNITQCRTPAQPSSKSPTFFVYDPNKSTLTSSNDPSKSTVTSPRVLHTSSSTISMGQKEKTEAGTEVGEGVKKNPTQIWPYFCGILFNSFPNFPQYATVISTKNDLPY